MTREQLNPLGDEPTADQIEQPPVLDDSGVFTDGEGNRHSIEAFEDPGHNEAVLAFEGMLSARESDSFGLPGDHGEAPQN